MGLTNSGHVIYVQNMSRIWHDIENDSATGKYLNGVIPDQISESAVIDMRNRIFSIMAAKNVQPPDTWVSNITLITNHPVNLSNFDVLKSQIGDTAEIEMQAHAFARSSPGDDPYMQGNQEGSALVSYSTGIPFCYSTQSEIVTTTSYYDINQNEKFILKLD